MSAEQEQAKQLERDHKMALEVLKGMNQNSRALLLKHIVNLQSEQLNRLIKQPDTVKVFRAQGAVSVLQEVIELFDS